MKKMFTGLILMTVLFLSAACDNDPQDQPQTDNAAPTAEPSPGMGRLTVDLDGTDGRTLLPEAPEFSRYALTFRYLAGGVNNISETVDTLPFSIELVPGNWNVTVTGYTYIENVEGILDGHYIAASGEKTVTIEAGVTTPVTVDLSRRSGVKGVFQYDIGLPAADLNGANLNILRTDRTEVTTKDLLEAASGSIALDEGYYFVQVRVVTGRVRSKTELIHIYSGHTTVAEGSAWDFDNEEGVFLSAAELSEYLSYAQANTADNPYELKLTADWESLSVPITGGDEALGQLFSALHGRYARLDLSDVTGVMGNTYTAYPEELSGDRDKLLSVILPEGLTQIGDGAFYGCTSFERLILPDTVESIGSYAFYGCTGLSGITIPNNVTSIGDNAFGNCQNLTVTIQTDKIPTTSSNNWNTIFSNNTALSVIFGDDITSITDYAFSGCTGLTGVTIPNSVTSIGSSAFNGCTGLTDVTIPVSVTSIADSAFDGCTGLENVIIGNGVTSLNGFSFSGNTNLTSVSIGNKITSIGENAFDGCSGLTSITIPNSVTGIGDSAFDGCSGLTSVTIGNSVTSIGSSAFSGCRGLTSITIPNSVTGIGDSAFDGCSGLTSVTIPNSVTSIGSSAFSGCSGLTSITIPGSVTGIGSSAFYNCTGLTSVTFNGTITSSGFSSISPFPGDLRTKYLDGGPGIYITTNPGSGAVWTKGGSVADITAPFWREGSAISLVAPLIAFPAGETVTAQGWQIIDTGNDGWANFTPPTTAAMSYNGKYLRYYATGSGGVTVCSNVVIIIVIEADTIVVTNTGEWNAALNTIRNGGNDYAYIIHVSGDIGIAGSTDNTFDIVTGLSVTLQGNGRLYLTSRGSLIRLAASQTLIIDSAGLTLQGLKNGQNGATQDNNEAVVYVNGSNAQLELRNGTISGNTRGGVNVSSGTFTMNGGTISGNTADNNATGGVSVSGTFIMNGGTISGNTNFINPYGGGVYVSYYGTFTMNGGEISGNTAANYGHGGGVYVNSGTFTMYGGEISGNSASNYGGGVHVANNATFRIVTGTVYGSNASPTNLRNTAGSGGAALSGTAQRGTFNGETWVSAGNLSTTDDTIMVVNGALQ